MGVSEHVLDIIMISSVLRSDAALCCSTVLYVCCFPKQGSRETVL